MDTNGTKNWQYSPAGKKVMDTFAEERTLHSINQLLQKVETLEQAVGRMTMMMEQAPGMVAMVGDMVDEGYQQAAAKGVNVDERLKTTLTLLEKLTDPQVVEKLDGLLQLADQAPGLMAMVGDMVDDGYRAAAARGVSIDERIKSTLALTEKLTDPQVVEKLDGLLQLADQAPGLMAMVGDMVDDGYRAAAARGVSIDERIKSTLALTEKLTDPQVVEKLDGLLQLADQTPGLMAMVGDMVDDGMRGAIAAGLDPQKIGGTLGDMGIALSQARSEPPKEIGTFGLLRALNDKDRQRGLGFLMNFLKHLGQKL